MNLTDHQRSPTPNQPSHHSIKRTLLVIKYVFLNSSPLLLNETININLFSAIVSALLHSICPHLRIDQLNSVPPTRLPEREFLGFKAFKNIFLINWMINDQLNDRPRLSQPVGAETLFSNNNWVVHCNRRRGLSCKMTMDLLRVSRWLYCGLFRTIVSLSPSVYLNYLFGKDDNTFLISCSTRQVNYIYTCVTALAKYFDSFLGLRLDSLRDCR